MKNRHGVEYCFEEIEPGVYTIRGDLKYWRFGGHEGVSDIDMSDLGFVDPSGGPFLAVGTEIEGRPIRHISVVTEWVTPFQKQQQIRFVVDDRPQNPDLLQ
jgi:hypothetical protein